MQTLNIKGIKYCKPWTLKGFSLCHKLGFSNPFIFAHCLRPLIYQTMNFARSNIQSYKYQRFTLSGFKDIGIIKLEFVSKTQFLKSFVDRVCILFKGFSVIYLCHGNRLVFTFKTYNFVITVKCFFFSLVKR